MKRCLLILICIVIPICVRSQVDTLLSSGRIPMYAKVISDEKSFGSSFVINTRFYMLDTITIDSVKYELPSCFSVTSATNIIGIQKLPMDSTSFDVTVNNSCSNNLPFYPVDLSILVYYSTTRTHENNISLALKIYYTPYNTIEIWDLAEYNSIPRRWFDPCDNPNAQRKPIPQSSIPLSDITDWSLYEPSDENWTDWRIDNFREVEVDGLAYAVLMQPIPNDSIAYYDAIGEDSIQIRSNFSGTVIGRITANKLGPNAQIGLAGLKVQLMEADSIFGKVIYQHFGTSYTNDNGYFIIPYNEFQLAEGGYVELYLKVFAKDNGTYKIVGNSSLFGAQTKLIKIGSKSHNAGTITCNVDFSYSTAYDAFRCVHWVRKGCEYFKDESNNFYSGIRIKTNCNIDGAFSNNYIFPQKPVLHIGNEKGRTETTPRHEFGHTAMYFLQNKNMKIPYGVSGVNYHEYNLENTSLLAFYEGWAEFVAAMLDAVYYLEDNEYGDEFENNIKHSGISNGFCSEYNIASALYDLWDGPNKGLPNNMPTNSAYHGWNDNNALDPSFNKWETIDNLELTLSQICAPLKKVTNKNKLENMRCIQQYIDTLLSLNPTTTCQDKRDIIRVFRENRVVWNVEDYNNGKKSIGNESLDGMFTQKQKNETGYFFNLMGIIPSLDYSIISSFWSDTYNISCLNENATNNWNFCPNTSAVQPIIDDYLVGYYDPSDNRFTNMNLNTYNSHNIQSANFYTCGNDNVINVRNGTLTLGSTDGIYKANLTIANGSLLEISDGDASLVVNSGSVLTISQGGTLCVKEKGKIIVRGNGRIEVEDGAYICISSEADVILQMTNSIINIAENAIVDINPIHTANVGYHSCDFPCSNYTGSGSVNCACGFGVFDYNDDYIASGSESITGTKKFRQNVIIPSGVTLTLSNATFEMKENKSIIINAGGKLVVDNSTITNSSYCSDKMWDGIYVVGNKNLPQIAVNQGTLEINNNSVIENAKCAIITSNGSNVNTSGGIVKCMNSTFRNNGRSIEFIEYTNHTTNGTEIGNEGYVKKCTFLVNDNNIFASSGITFGEFVKISNVNGISFGGSTFRDARATASSQTKGIWSIGAGYTASSECSLPYNINNPCTCPGIETRPKFSRLGYGIYADNSGSTYNFVTDHAIFDTCYRSVYMSAVNNSNITRGDFDQSSQGIFPGGYSTGVYIDNCTGYIVEGNNFTTNYTSCPFAFNGRAIYVNNSGSYVNTIYRNNISNLYHGIRTNGSNSGLQMQCNEFSYIFNADIKILGQVSSIQGSTSKSAGNKFTIDVDNIDAANSLTYYHSGQNSQFNVFCPYYSSSSVTLVPNITANSCNSTICLPPVTPPIIGKSASDNDDITLYESLQQIYESRLADYNAAGYDFLLENFEEGDADIVATARLMQDTLISIRRTMAEIANRNIDAILQDTLILDREALNGWYNRINTQTAKYSLVNSYFEMGEYALARQELAAIPQRFALTTDELAEYDNFCQYESLRESVYTSGRNYAQLTEDEIAELQTIADRNTGVSSAYANSVLCFFYSICRDDEEMESDFDIEGPINSKSTTAVAESETEPLAIYVYPNPANEELNILLNSLPEGKTTIEFHDVTGRLVLSEEINSTTTSINISSLRQGVYMYRIVNGDNVIARDRIVKE